MKTKEIKAMSIEEMENKLDELKDKLFKQRIQKSLGQSDNPNKIRGTRKDIAKINTILTEKRSKNGREEKAKE